MMRKSMFAALLVLIMLLWYLPGTSTFWPEKLESPNYKPFTNHQIKMPMFKRSTQKACESGGEIMFISRQK